MTTPPRPPPQELPRTGRHPYSGHARLRELLRRLTTVGGGPGALAEVHNRHGGTVPSSGVARVHGHAPVRASLRDYGGDTLGHETAGGATVDDRQATVMVHVDPGGSDAQDHDMEAAIRTALCEDR